MAPTGHHMVGYLRTLQERQGQGLGRLYGGGEISSKLNLQLQDPTPGLLLPLVLPSG